MLNFISEMEKSKNSMFKSDKDDSLTLYFNPILPKTREFAIRNDFLNNF